ncbi:hypothetical protein JAAARDRAFT_135150 [Jaapia argillacea MUCL 33604]|uniref:RanBP2-type domain-containing protein n=1 Tax=Jaapia argillacea MUCL 33604 TaxID=933084 RepID=A0A067PVW6_9AGAM|nr:hypothetical protein JAAARDRAFT_135150 [Jaapia argillacea MUCL 33604]
MAPTATLWVAREDHTFDQPFNGGSVWAVFKTHEEARSALSLSSPSFSVTPALERDLEPFHKLRRLQLSDSVRTPHMTNIHTLSPTHSEFQTSSTFNTSYFPLHKTLDPRLTTNFYGHRSEDSLQMREAFGNGYTLSSNPPNAHSTFRLGDWICPAVHCAAHNFGRNMTCIGCGSSRPGDGLPSPVPRSPVSWMSSIRALSSPRFVGAPHLQSCESQHLPSGAAPRPVHSSTFSQPHSVSQVFRGKPPAPSYPLLTPSGRALSLGGKVQNVSNDPLTPCVMWWPDNEPLPEQGQIRPTGIISIQHPPILNTGNRGPIEHQPGDWICQKCSYLNWRRRKVCQTCFPYAEGNGDSISSAVQAERIALLASVIASQTQPSPPTSIGVSHYAGDVCDRASVSQPPPLERPSLFIDLSHPNSQPPARHQNEMSPQYVNVSPIYQTSAHRRSTPSTPCSSTNLSFCDVSRGPEPLLPSFLHEIVRSPSLSPSSSSSSGSLAESEDGLSHADVGQIYGGEVPFIARESYTSLHGGNIWQLDGEETKALTSLAERPIGSERKQARLVIDSERVAIC